MNYFVPPNNLNQPGETGERTAGHTSAAGELNLAGLTQGQSWAQLQNRLRAGLFVSAALPPGMGLEIATGVIGSSPPAGFESVGSNRGLPASGAWTYDQPGYDGPNMAAPAVIGSSPPPGQFGEVPAYYGPLPARLPVQNMILPQMEPGMSYTGPLYSNGGRPHLTVPSWAGTARGTYAEGATPAQAAAWNRVNQMAMNIYLSAPSLVDQNGPIAAAGYGYPYNPNTIYGVGALVNDGSAAAGPNYTHYGPNMAGLRQSQGA